MQKTRLKPDSAVRVTINGEARDLPDGLTVATLLERLGLHPRLVVVERNHEILRTEEYPSTALVDGDHLELVHFVGGG